MRFVHPISLEIVTSLYPEGGNSPIVSSCEAGKSLQLAVSSNVTTWFPTDSCGTGTRDLAASGQGLEKWPSIGDIFSEFWPSINGHFFEASASPLSNAGKLVSGFVINPLQSSRAGLAASTARGESPYK